MLHIPKKCVELFIFSGSILGLGMFGLARSSFADTPPITNPTPLEIHSGTAKDLGEIPVKNSIIWLGGVGGGGDENEEVEDFLYEIHQNNTTFYSPEHYLIPKNWDSKSGENRGGGFFVPLTLF